MNNVRFYLEYPNNKEKRKATRKNLGNHIGNCIAIFTDMEANRGNYNALSAVFMSPNSDTNFGEVSIHYLYEKCKRISEEVAKKIHPKLYNRLIDEED